MGSYLRILGMTGTIAGCALPPATEPAAPARQAQSPPSRAYDCDDGVVTPPADPVAGLAVGDARARFVRHDRAGDHYALERDGATIEYLVPIDWREDLVVRTARAHATCVARGGHADLLARWIRGDSVGEIAAALGVAPDDVRWRLIGSVRWARSRIGYDTVLPAFATSEPPPR